MYSSDMIMGKLSEEQIFTCLKSLHVPVRSSDIYTPSQGFMLQVLTCFLRDQHITISSQSTRSFDAIGHIENTDAFHDGLSMCHLVMLIAKILKPQKIIFSIKDIVEPKPKRTKRLLNHLIIFWSYIKKKDVLFESVLESLEEEIKEVDKMVDDISTLQIRIDEHLSVLNKMGQSKEELQSCVSSKSEKSKELEKQYKVVTDEYELVLKKKEKDLAEKITSLDINILSVKEQIIEIEQLILPSPDRLSIDLQRIKDIIKNEDIKIREKELDLKEKKKRLDTHTKTNDLNQKALQVLHEFKGSLEEFSNSIDLFLSGHQNLENEGEQFKKIMSELQKKNEIKNIYMEKEMKISLTTQKQKEPLEETFASLKKKFSNELKALELFKLNNVDIEQKMDKVADSITEIVINLYKQAERLTETEFAEYTAKMEAIHSSFIQDCKDVKEAVKLVFKS